MGFVIEKNVTNFDFGTLKCLNFRMRFLIMDHSDFKTKLLTNFPRISPVALANLISVRLLFAKLPVFNEISKNVYPCKFKKPSINHT